MTNIEDRKYLVMAYENATESPDPSTQNGSVLINDSMGSGVGIIGQGCNTYPEGVRDQPDRLVSPKKYAFVEHAERSAIYAAAREGHSCEGSTLYCPWFACCDCARAIIKSGVRRVVGHQRMMDLTPDRWKESIGHAFEMLKEAKIETLLLQGPLPEAPEIRFNGEVWQP